MNVYFGADGKIDAGRSTEHVFLFDISSGVPRQTQVLPVPNSFYGLVWAPTSNRLFVSGGQDDTVLEFVNDGAKFVVRRTIQLRHQAGLGIKTKPVAAGLAISPDATRLLVANLQNDSLSMIDLASGRVTAEQDLRPESST